MNFKRGIDPKSSLQIGLEGNQELLTRWFIDSLVTLGFRDIKLLKWESGKWESDKHKWRIIFSEKDIRTTKDYIWIIDTFDPSDLNKKYRLRKGTKNQLYTDKFIEIRLKLQYYLEGIARGLKNDSDDIYDKISKLSEI